ncbi:hypothetical protein [Natronolimnobius baerhuensis]|nr:hypothetical protein [Natronolimnobius baerhuensis]
MAGSHTQRRQSGRSIAYHVTAIRTRLERVLACRTKRISTYSGP